jgi:hypothetical protein
VLCVMNLPYLIYVRAMCVQGPILSQQELGWMEDET